MTTADPAPRLVPFVCTACKARLRLPAHYLGKAILCPKCTAPQRVVDADAPAEPMDTTRALVRADEVPERPVGALSGASPIIKPAKPFSTPLPSSFEPDDGGATMPIPQAHPVGDGPDFQPITMPAARPVTASALTQAGRRPSAEDPAPAIEGMTMAISSGSRPAATPPAPPAPPAASRTLVAVLVVLGVVCVGLSIALVAALMALGTARDQQRAAEERAVAARTAADEAAKREAVVEARLDELIHQLRRRP